MKDGIRQDQILPGSLKASSQVIEVDGVWALRIDSQGIHANPDIPIDETAKAVLQMVQCMGFGKSEGSK